MENWWDDGRQIRRGLGGDTGRHRRRMDARGRSVEEGGREGGEEERESFQEEFLKGQGGVWTKVFEIVKSL